MARPGSGAVLALLLQLVAGTRPERQLQQAGTPVGPVISQDVGPVPPGDVVAAVPGRQSDAVDFAGSCQWRQGNDDCADGYTCVGLPSNISSGVCVSEPPGGTGVPLGLAKPIFYFPLVSGSLSSWPWGSRTARLVAQGGAASTLTFEAPDDSDLIPKAFRCPGNGGVLQVDNFLYGRSGRFAVNLWMRAANSSLQPRDSASSTPHTYEYLAAHANSAPGSTAPTAFAPNQWALYTPASGRPLRGIARAVLKDSTDGTDLVYLDSDGAIGDNTRSTPLPALFANVSDGEWHMITLTTRPDFGKGFMLYVDGALSAQLPAPTATSGSSETDGGDSLVLTGPLTLCGWTPGDAGRAFTGNLAHLMILDAPLNALDVKALFDQVNSGFGLGQAAVLTPVSTQDFDVGADGSAEVISVTAPTLFDTTTLFWPRVPPSLERQGATTLVSGRAPPSTAASGASGNQAVVFDKGSGSTCTLDLANTSMQLEFCQAELVCVPQRTWGLSDSRVTRSSATFPAGVCTEPVVGVLLPDTYPPAFPAPLAWFPLTGDQLGTSTNLRSWPDQTYGAPVGTSAQFILDSRFGSALSCNRSVPPIQLQTVPYSINGGFAISLWLRTSEAQMTGQYFSYIFSHAARNVTDLMTSPNQVHVYLPQQDNPFYGVSARVILRDSLSSDAGRPSQVWLDTNGQAGDDEAAEVVIDGVKIDDGEWHMLTVTTLPSLMDLPGFGAAAGGAAGASSSAEPRPSGFALYVDGILRGVLNEGSTRHVTNDSDTDIQITGGHPAYLDGPITLCGRTDQQPNRTFGGALSNLMLFDTALTQTQVAQLYTAYSRQAVRYPFADTSDAGRTANRTTTDGRQCVFPLSFGGRLYYDCIYLQGVLSCPTRGNLSWAPCTSPDPENIPDEDLDLTAFAVIDGTQVGPGDGSIARVTTSGQMCIIPFMYQQNTYADCIKTNGSEYCMVPGGAMQECAPAVDRSPAGPGACTDAASSTPATKSFSRCVAIKGTTMCRTPRGTWLICAPQHAARITMQAKTCQVPFPVKGLARSDCVLNPNLQGLDQEVCHVAGADATSSVLQTCQPAYTNPPILTPRTPTRFTLDGQRCIAPGPGALSECLDYSGSGTPMCETNTGAVFECAPARRNGSLTNDQCDFPFQYRDFNRTDCVWLDGIEACKTVTGHWEECKPWVLTQLPDPPPNTTARFSTQGMPCALPYNLQGLSFWDCIGADESQAGYCRTSDGSWQSCAPLDTSNTRSTITGDPCVLPFEWQGVMYYDCMGPDARTGSTGVCLTRTGQFTACSPRQRVGASTGRPCVFPAFWRGRDVNDCVIGPLASWQPACLVDASNTSAWEACAPVYAGSPAGEGAPDAGGGGGGGGGAPGDPQLSGIAALAAPEVRPSTNSQQAQGGSNLSKKHRDLALGLVFGLGGGLLLLTLGLILGRRAWQRSHRAKTMREMGFTGPGAGPGGAAAPTNSSSWSGVKALEVPDYSPAGAMSTGSQSAGPSFSGPASVELGKASAHSLARFKDLPPASPPLSPQTTPGSMSSPQLALNMSSLPAAATHAERVARFKEATGVGTGATGAGGAGPVPSPARTGDSQSSVHPVQARVPSAGATGNIPGVWGRAGGSVFTGPPTSPALLPPAKPTSPAPPPAADDAAPAQ